MNRFNSFCISFFILILLITTSYCNIYFSLKHVKSPEQLITKYSQFHNSSLRRIRQRAEENNLRNVDIPGIIIFKAERHGISNNFRAMFGVFLMALLSKRLFFIDFDSSSFNIDDILLPPGFQWNLDSPITSSKDAETISNAKTMREIIKDNNLIFNSKSCLMHTQQRRCVRHAYHPDKKVRTCTRYIHSRNKCSWHTVRQHNFYETFRSENVLIISAYKDFVIDILENPYYTELLVNSFNLTSEFEIESLQYRLSRILLHPTQEVQNIIDDYIEQNFKGRFTVGIQLRTFWMSRQYSEEWQHRFLPCLLQTAKAKPDHIKRGILRHQFFNEENYADMNPLKKKDVSHQKVAIFLATDSSIAQKQARKVINTKYPDVPVLFYDKPIVHTGINPHQETDAISQDQKLTHEAIIKVLVDFWLLGETDVLLWTHRSSFGRQARRRTLVPAFEMPESYPPWCTGYRGKGLGFHFSYSVSSQGDISFSFSDNNPNYIWVYLSGTYVVVLIILVIMLRSTKRTNRKTQIYKEA